jgi:hypothetical protein
MIPVLLSVSVEGSTTFEHAAHFRHARWYFTLFGPRTCSAKYTGLAHEGQEEVTGTENGFVVILEGETGRRVESEVSEAPEAPLVGETGDVALIGEGGRSTERKPVPAPYPYPGESSVSFESPT